MPFDPHTFPSEVPTPITVLDFTVAEFRDFALSKPADEAYKYFDIHGCALCQFLREEMGAVRPSVGNYTWSAGERGERVSRYFDRKLDTAVATLPHAWGALAKRLRALSA